ncbi:MAG: hypothetical protein NTY83_01170 [Candidatus Micrarchaeota archaeon]|nr:hypothetical protein [Candidatus Micrarchaeota archaeon]
MEFAQRKLGADRLRPVPEVEVIFTPKPNIYDGPRSVLGMVSGNYVAQYSHRTIYANGWKVHWNTDPRRESTLVHECGHALFEEHALRHNTAQEVMEHGKDAVLCATEGVSTYLEAEKLNEMGYARSAWTSFRRFVTDSIDAVIGFFSGKKEGIDHHALGDRFFSSLVSEIGAELAFATVTCNIPYMHEIHDHRFYLSRVFPERYAHLKWEALGCN